jgi:5-methylcytosine-specific restriction endonuclease McrA
MKNGQRQNKTKGKTTYVEQEIWAVNEEGRPEGKTLENIKQKSLKDMVLQRFNSIQGKKLPEPFYTFDDHNLHLNNNLLNVFSTKENSYLNDHVLSRWSMLEHAFSEPEFADTLTVDERYEHFRNKKTRTNITKFRDVLSGYQSDTCFYCAGEIHGTSEVDHVIPHKVVGHDDIWNLVLAHVFCNQEKSDKMPAKKFVDRLISRNEDVLHSDLPLKEHLKLVVGETPKKRQEKIETAYQKGLKFNLGTYDPIVKDGFNNEFLYGKVVRWYDSLQ